jgi:hypothetical protein
MFIPVPKTHHTTVKYTQQFSKHTSGVYTQRCATQTPSTGPLLVICQHELTFLQSESLQTQVLLSQFPNNKSSNQQESVVKYALVYTRLFPIMKSLQNQCKSVHNNAVAIETSPCLLSRMFQCCG